ncbi:molybdopterin converting factor subunit 1 [Futiania mangrovi]|uniref:Molybdopterin synthase sulfur carrier subunit n=1 Tax=Futiania mangrovi TaxID=2959716 RepID=A0A9J6PLD0_9PROT|nr:molybdopterin converting factor subunit 1 [Futiania mangrovii]MCP1337439.1 molybdopterin converting factor subunit 1 [Futiania mangrovii]
MRVLYFAWLRQKIGTGEETVSPPAGVRTVGQLAAWLAEQGPGYAEAFADPALIRAAVNQTHADPDAAVAPGDEVAFFPPVTGG